ncbi:MAG: hypothetical protein U0871_26830 [Gemmataceae bacterium]
MRFPVSVRWLTVPAVAAAVFAILTADPAARSAREGDGCEPDPAAVAPDPETREAHRRLAAKLDAVVARMHHKEWLVDELIAGRADLMTVADEFLRMNREEPQCLAVLRRHFPGGSDREVAARNVIEYVAPRVKPADRVAVRQRLDREFVVTFGRS